MSTFPFYTTLPKRSLTIFEEEQNQRSQGGVEKIINVSRRNYNPTLTNCNLKYIYSFPKSIIGIIDKLKTGCANIIKIVQRYVSVNFFSFTGCFSVFLQIFKVLNLSYPKLSFVEGPLIGDAVPNICPFQTIYIDTNNGPISLCY